MHRCGGQHCDRGLVDAPASRSRIAAGLITVDDFVIARNPDPDSTLPYLVRLPLGVDGVVLKTRELWPRTAKLYCHAADEWPADVDVLERVGVRSCVRRGAAIDLVLDRGREARSMFVFARARGRDVIFWQSARTAKQARPNVNLPTARASGQVLTIAVDVHEREIDTPIDLEGL